MKKELIINTLEEQGFKLEELDDLGYLFQYGESKFLLMPEDKDDDMLRFALPSIYDVNDDNRAMILDIVNDLNLCIKYTKACVYMDGVWVFYEHRLSGNEDLNALIEHILNLMMFTTFIFHKKVNGDFEYDNEEEEES